ncbi:hypothetical protein F7734_20115 [Scytonema sp. UIC 10036]|uniref:hypothetical protein n=1 Tax=Scytonema sp. UIC 10036 TaxID=2304196 RepID=UPI0012DA8513|nr:hypothetical protein [Scytonema sp. UIC 10036]MUG94556.1 hypothetical protein [Scytonema sp. UIC 10036]
MKLEIGKFLKDFSVIFLAERSLSLLLRNISNKHREVYFQALKQPLSAELCIPDV